MSGDLQFNGTDEEWNALVERNRIEQKRQQKELLIEIMEADEKNGLYETVTNGHSLTAVEWLVKQLFSTYEKLMNEDIIEQAKEMEKEQIMKAYDDGAIETMQEQEGLDISMDQNGEESERYYNKKYK